MQFNSYIYILLFLPVTWIVYFLGNRINKFAGKLVLILASILFYTYTDYKVFLVLGISLVLNYIFAILIKKQENWKRIYLLAPVIINVGLLLYFKYTNFLINNLNSLLGMEWGIKDLILPLGISFFTFQQIAYIVSTYNGEIEEPCLVDYLCYILYFPKILMGPLADPVDFITQLNNEDNKRIDWDNVACGVKMFSFGLFKKVMIADVFAKAVAWGFEDVLIPTAMEWILIMLFYTFEIYFDFSGYSDMAVGASLLFNITLPINFDSPYKARNIREFWKGWHVSLTKFFTKYIYIPLGGSKKGNMMTYINTLIVFFISGLWHGANWTFILWGVLHGLLMVFDRIADELEKKVFEPVRWILTFGAVNILWLLFRSESIGQWVSIIRTMVLQLDTSINEELINCFILPEMSFLTDKLHIGSLSNNIRGFWMIMYILGAFTICLVPANNYQKMKRITLCTMFLAAIALVWGVICLGGESVFVYYNF